MEALLLIIAIGLLWLDLGEHRLCHDSVIDLPTSPQLFIGQADADIQALTEEAVSAMLAEVRREFDRRDRAVW